MDGQALRVAIDTMWVLMTAFLVFFMNLGFAMVESGLCRVKNTVNILAKNFVVFAVSSLAYYALGFGIMYGDGTGLIGLRGLLALSGLDNSPATGSGYRGAYGALAWAGVPLAAKFFFQLVFCGTAATIVSGAVAERIRFPAFIVFSAVVCAVLYPVTGHWIWGGGWLAGRGMVDFAGSSVVHSAGGWAALAGVLVLGPRIGRYRSDGSARPMYGHNMSLATLGVFVLWFGWFGFNPGSTMALNGPAIAHIALTTNSAAAASTLGATAMAWLLLGKPDLSMILNGCLAGLVAITAGCAYVGVPSALGIGLAAGIIVVPTVLLFDRLKLDDPVGALSVHLACGVLGTLAVGVFADKRLAAAIGTDAPSLRDGVALGGGLAQLGSQALGVAAVGAFTFAAALALWLTLKLVMGIRVSREEEMRGLDIGEHGMEAYAGFQTFTNT
jgi:Amt family ammonium transporter